MLYIHESRLSIPSELRENCRVLGLGFVCDLEPNQPLQRGHEIFDNITPYSRISCEYDDAFGVGFGGAQAQNLRLWCG